MAPDAVSSGNPAATEIVQRTSTVVAGMKVEPLRQRLAGPAERFHETAHARADRRGDADVIVAELLDIPGIDGADPADSRLWAGKERRSFVEQIDSRVGRPDACFRSGRVSRIKLELA